MDNHVKNNKKTNIRLRVSIALTLLFLIAVALYLNTAHLRSELQLELEVQLRHRKADSFQVSLDEKKPVTARIRPRIRFQRLRFFLPDTPINDLRIFLGVIPARTAIRTITIKSIFRDYIMDARKIKTLFKGPANVKTSVKEKSFYIHTTAPRQALIPDKKFYKLLTSLQSSSAIYYFLSLLLALLIFYFSYTIDLRRLLFFPLPHRVLLLFFIPLLVVLFNISGESGLTEKREIARRPQFRLDSPFNFAPQYTTYYNDNFPFHSQFIYINNRIKTSLFGISPTKKVVMGKAGWLFLDDYNNQPGTIQYFRALSPMTSQQLEAWKAVLETRQQKLAAQGISYLFMIVPNKNTIYPEYMPAHIRKMSKKSRLDQLVQYLTKHSSVPILDFRAALVAAKKNYPVYSITDSHWNEYGAYIAFCEMLRKISGFPSFEAIEIPPVSQFRIEAKNHSGGDLAEMLSLQKEVMREDMIRVTPLTGLLYTGDSLPKLTPFVRQGFTINKNSSLPGILMVHDSFYKKLKPFLSNTFSRVLYIWDWDMNFYTAVIEREAPKLVIDQMAERFLLKNPPKSP